MPGRDITRPRNEWAARVILLLAFVMGAGAFLQSPAQPQTSPAQSQPQNPPSDAAKPDSQSNEDSPKPDAPQKDSPKKDPQDNNDNGVFVFRKDVDEVLL